MSALTLVPLALDGVFRVDPAPVEDERGCFARLWCRESFRAAGLDLAIEQTSASFNRQAGTLRGLHFAWPPAREAKIVRCARGRMLDVLLDLRPGSPTYLGHLAVELDPDRRTALVVPPGVAHGFQTLVDDTEVHYMMSEAYRPDCSAGVRPDDPVFGVAWPLPVRAISPRDRDAPDFDDAAHRHQWAARQAGLVGEGG